jgi:hypothetical protein
MWPPHLDVLHKHHPQLWTWLLNKPFTHFHICHWTIFLKPDKKKKTKTKKLLYVKSEEEKKRKRKRTKNNLANV